MLLLYEEIWLLFPLLKALLEVLFCQLVENLHHFYFNRLPFSAVLHFWKYSLGARSLQHGECCIRLCRWERVNRQGTIFAQCFMQNLSNNFFDDSCHFSKSSHVQKMISTGSFFVFNFCLFLKFKTALGADLLRSFSTVRLIKLFLEKTGVPSIF